jgi:hypothetical protein
MDDGLEQDRGSSLVRQILKKIRNAQHTGHS